MFSKVIYLISLATITAITHDTLAITTTVIIIIIIIIIINRFIVRTFLSFE